MLSYRQAFPQAFANRPCPFPNHYLVTPDEVRTMLAKHGFKPMNMLLQPKLTREATQEELKNPAIRTYQLITNVEAARRSSNPLPMLGRTYCFGESIPEIPERAEKETTSIAPWQKHRITTAHIKKTKPTHRVTCEVLNKGGNLNILTVKEYEVVGFEEATKLSERLSTISSAACGFGWVDVATLLGDEMEGTVEDIFWCDGTAAARVLTRPV